jgi:HEAT repeat protein
MRYPALFLILGFAVGSAGAAPPEWAQFSDPKSVALTEPFAKAIAALPPDEKATAMRRLQDALSSTKIEIRRRAALALGALGDKSGVPTMIHDMATKNDNARDNAAVALRLLKDPRAIPVLRASLRDKDPHIRSIALSALGEMKATQAFAEIAAHLYDKEREKNTCVSMPPADSAMYAIGALGDRRAIPLLVKALDDADVAFAATQALTALTGEPFGKNADQWKKWWKASQTR